MRIVTWNVNSINCRLGHVLSLIELLSPEVILLQEIKTITEKFPYKPLSDKGYNCAVYGQKTYNGVAILSKKPLSNIKTKFYDCEDGEARYIECIIDKIRVASVYVPNGSEVDSPQYEKKLRFMRLLSNYLEKENHPTEGFIIGGDFNIAMHDCDVWDKKFFEGKLLFTEAERLLLKQVEKAGFTDAFAASNIEKYQNLNKLCLPGASDGTSAESIPKQNFTWWDYRAGAFNKNHGVRLDYLFLSACASSWLRSSEVLEDFRKQSRPSDHAPLLAELDI